ncbi:ABC transporter permease [Paenibacillus selenitireducens]|uniref:ABC transporter permease n=1 Tax=Paenibacillus selenitireducens TaxID=1324314 RepID=A0A1T2XNU1_9BACL|nr:ABC transporter permease [Paenibacillus selenitireducens]OPA81498.1 ABC transporter permease [Paenibacillus selenitireducens]
MFSRGARRSALGLVMVLPSFFLLLFMIVVPIFTSIQESLKGNDGNFTWDNYKYLFTDPAMSSSIKYTIHLTVVSSIMVLVIAYLLAVFLRFSTGRLAKWIERLYYIPMFIPSVIATYGMINMYGNHGWLARIMLLFTNEPFMRIIYDYKGLLLANLWFNIPFATMLLSSALSSIPNSAIEGAKDVGAGKIQIFIRIILPLSFKSMLVAATFVVMGVIGSFTAPFLIGPNAPQVLGVAMQQQFSVYFETGIASACAVFMFAICSLVGYFYIRSMMKEER